MSISKQIEEAADLLVEEMAESIQCISKIRRFGKDTVHKSVSNLTHLETEIGDVLALVDILKKLNFLNSENLEKYKINKLNKLTEWSKTLELVSIECLNSIQK